ncbi:MAG: alpha/beta hydrolase [Pseudomonadota bacterium]
MAAEGALARSASGAGPATSLPPGARAWDIGLALTASDGVSLRAALWHPKVVPGATAPDGERGLALYFPGRTEFLEKAALTATALSERGFTVASTDWRGQGLSTRPLPEPLKGHVTSFEEFDRDIEALLAAPEVARAGPVRLVLGHSMGGAIALGALARGVLSPNAVVLSAPLAGIAFTKAQNAVVRFAARTARRLGLGERWPPAPNAGKPTLFLPFEGNCLTHDPAQYAWQGDALRAEPGLQLGLPTFGWLAAAYDAIALQDQMRPQNYPMQVVLGAKETVVSNPAARALAARVEARLDEVADAKHDILMEEPSRRAAVWQAIDAFLASSGI